MTLLPLLLLALLAGQSPSPDKAFTDANGLKDPQRRVAALAKFLEDYPNSKLVEFAGQELAAETVRTFPSDRQRILNTVKSAARYFRGSKEAEYYNNIAWQLYLAKLYPEEAEKLAKKAVKAWKFPVYAAEQRAAAAADKRAPPPEEILRTNFSRKRADTLDTLGQVYAREGKDEKARQVLREVLATNPAQAGAALTLAEIAERAGDSGEAIRYLTHAMLAKSNKETRKRLEGTWAKGHNGSLTGLEEYLDEQYARMFPSPVTPTSYRANGKRSDRLVLAEVHTGASCPPCAAVDLAFDVELRRYSRQDVAVVMYHQHIPRPDPMTNDDTEAQWEFHGRRGVPTYIIDGKLKHGGGPRDYTQLLVNRLEELIAPELERPAEARLALEGTREGRTLRVKAEARGIRTDSPGVTLRLALVEKLIRYSGENGIRFHPMVVRRMAAVKLEAAKAKTVEHTFDVDEVQRKIREHLDEFEAKDDGKYRFAERKDRVDETNLAVVAFLQDDKSKDVLQAAFLDLASPMVSQK